MQRAAMTIPGLKADQTTEAAATAAPAKKAPPRGGVGFGPIDMSAVKLKKATTTESAEQTSSEPTAQAPRHAAAASVGGSGRGVSMLPGFDPRTVTLRKTSPKAQGEISPSSRAQTLGTPLSRTASGSTKRDKAQEGIAKLFEWAQLQTAGYRGVDIKNWTTSWKDGLAFCALIHKKYPRLIDFDSLDPGNAQANLKLAFDLAERLGATRLLDEEDIVAMGACDRMCCITYVSELFKFLKT